MTDEELSYWHFKLFLAFVFGALWMQACGPSLGCVGG